MKALVTGASSGIGRDMAIYLSTLGYDLVLVSKTKSHYEEFLYKIKTNYTIYEYDLSDSKNCIELHEKEQDIDIVINNAGFGLLGYFDETSLEKEMSMIDTNIKAVHILTKLYLKDMILKNKGHILNVSSIAGLMPSGPLMSTYYATKSYIVSLTRAIQKELSNKKSNVILSLLCPGPTNTRFNEVAKAEFKVKAMSSDAVARYAIDKLLANKKIIIPGTFNRFYTRLAKITPTKVVTNIVYKMQYMKKK